MLVAPVLPTLLSPNGMSNQGIYSYNNICDIDPAKSDGGVSVHQLFYQGVQTFVCYKVYNTTSHSKIQPDEIPPIVQGTNLAFEQF
jgi:hypothetical protein